MKPLSKKVRILSGIFLALIFIILAPIILARSFGYHFGKFGDVFGILKTGGIYIVSDISGVKIYVDDEYYKDSGLFARNTLIQDLDPEKVHKIVAKKEGRHDWVKTLPVSESLVTESRLLMLEKNLKTREICPFFDSLNNGTTSPSVGLKTAKDLPKEILVNGFIPTNSEYRQLINLFSGKEFDVYSTSTISNKKNSIAMSTTTSTSTLPKKEIPKYFVDLGITDPDKLKNLIITSNQVAWLENGNIILNWIDDRDSPTFYYCLQVNNCRKQIILDWQDDIVRFDFLPGREDVFVVLIDSGIYAVEADDRSDRNIQPIYIGPNLDFRKNQSDQIIIKNDLIFYEIRI